MKGNFSILGFSTSHVYVYDDADHAINKIMYQIVEKSKKELNMRERIKMNPILNS